MASSFRGQRPATADRTAALNRAAAESYRDSLRQSSPPVRPTSRDGRGISPRDWPSSFEYEGQLYKTDQVWTLTEEIGGDHA